MAAWTGTNKIQTVLIFSTDLKMVAAWEALFKLRRCYVVHEKFPRHTLQAARLLSPALIIVDADMPQVERLALCKELRSTTQGALFVLAPRSGDSEMNEYSLAGVDEYLSPSISPVSLMARSMLWLSRYEWSPSRAPAESLYV